MYECWVMGVCVLCSCLRRVLVGAKWVLGAVRGLAFSSEGGSQIYKKSASIKLRPPYFGNKNFMIPHHRYTLPPKQTKVFLNKINTLLCGHLVTPYILVIKNVMTPYFSFQKFMTPTVYMGPPFRRKCQPPKMYFFLIYLWHPLY